MEVNVRKTKENPKDYKATTLDTLSHTHLSYSNEWLTTMRHVMCVYMDFIANSSRR